MNGPFAKDGEFPAKEETEIDGLIRAFIMAGHMHRSAVDGARETLGLHRSQHMMLVYLQRCAEPPTQKKIAQEFEISAAAVAVTLGKLEAAGYVTRQTGETDSRCKRVMLTEQGREILKKTRERFREADACAFRGFSSQDIAQMRAFLLRMKENLRETEIMKRGTQN